MNNEKKRWQKPEMIVLVRNKPEEAVLGSCKIEVDGPGPTDHESGCRQTLGESGTCGIGCLDVVAS